MAVPFTEENAPKRWPVLVGGGLVNVALGTYYAWSVFVPALEREFGWNRTQISSSFLYTTIALTVAAVPLGWLLDRYGPRRIAYLFRAAYNEIGAKLPDTIKVDPELMVRESTAQAHSATRRSTS